MRISDWSSDVCSSDLHRPGSGAPPLHSGLGPALEDEDLGLPSNWQQCPAAPRPCRGSIDHERSWPGAGRTRRRRSAWRRSSPSCRQFNAETKGCLTADRKSVVEGKSVSVRVDLGGRRIIKKKKTTTI